MYSSFLFILDNSLFLSYLESKYELLKMSGAILSSKGWIELNSSKKRT